MTILNQFTEFRSIPRLLMPIEESDIVDAIKIANKLKVSVHCYSAGFNWGYGTKDSVDEKAITLDLSQMNKILHFNKDLGIIRIQPGVTQGQLLAYLKANNLDFYVPNTGAGKRGSILGNALERGFGITPIHDHASSILSVRGILADGSIYKSAFDEIDPRLSECFTWGVGPQLDKMVSQSSWIIITEVSIQLKRKHECTDILLFSFTEDSFNNVISGLQHLLSLEDSSIGSIKIFNRRQILEQNLSGLSKTIFGEREWFMTMIIYTNSITRKSILKFIKKEMSNYTREGISFLNSKKLKFLIQFFDMIPIAAVNNYGAKLKDLNEMLRLACGETSEVGYRALDINYDYSTKKVFDFHTFNKKLVWLSPICPLDPQKATELIGFIRKINQHPYFKFNTFTWTVLNQRTLALVIPILYEEKNEEEFWEWYKTIHLELKVAGFIPYRFHVKMMSTVREKLLPNYFKHVAKFENAMDPDARILRGRY